MLNLPAPLDIQWPKCFQLQGASPPDPLTRGSAPDPRYRLVLRTRHGASQPVTPSAAYASEAEPPLLHITTLTTADMTEQELLHHRLEDAALQLSVFSGVSVSPETLDHPSRQILLDAHGLHMLLMNDIFSYDRDKGMYGWTSWEFCRISTTA